MKKSFAYVLGILGLTILGSYYLSTSVEAQGTKDSVSPSSTSVVRYAVEALQASGAAVLCGDMGSSSTTNINRLLAEVSQDYRGPINIRPMENSSAACLFLSR